MVQNRVTLLKLAKRAEKAVTTCKDNTYNKNRISLHPKKCYLWDYVIEPCPKLKGDRVMKKTIVITAIGILWVIVPQTQAALIEIAIEAEVTDVDDSGNLLEGNVNVGYTITGSYKYDSDTPDSSPADPVQGNYWNYSSSYGVTLSVGGFVFKSDPSNIEFFIFIRDNTSLGNDIYGFDSYNNLTLPNNIPVGLISWVLKDYSGSALLNDGLQLTAPVLNDWTDENQLTITGGGDPKMGGGPSFGIGAEVTSAVLIPEPTSFVLLVFGGLIIRKRSFYFKR